MTTELLNELKTQTELPQPFASAYLGYVTIGTKLMNSRYFKLKYFLEKRGCKLPTSGTVACHLGSLDCGETTSPGTGFYTQSRVGLDGRVFKVVKLRSMCCDAEAGGKFKWSGKADVRVTRLGRVLRKLHLDETPAALECCLWRNESSRAEA